jgi:ribosomal-protein-alanine N-acetyltransferase
MCYDMLEQPHDAFKTKDGFAIACPETPLWVFAEERLFFYDFLRQNKNPLLGIIAEKKTALACAEIYSRETSVSFTQKELVAYFLPNEISLEKITAHGELRPAADSSLASEWIKKFYEETLDSPPPQMSKSSLQKSFPLGLRLFFLHDNQNVAMGMLSGTGETCRLNLIYVTPEARGRGYGRAIVTALAQEARKFAKIPVLYTAAENVAANALYAAVGFQEAGRLTEVKFV